MKREDSIRIGVIHKPWGHKGELILDLLAHKVADLNSEGWLFVDIDSQRVPFKYVSLRENQKQGALVLFRDYTSPEEASFFTGRDVFAPQASIINERKHALAEEDLIGIRVVDTAHGELGHIIRAEGSSAQTVMVILKESTEIMVPLAEDLIEAFDPEAKLLTISTPPGLIDMYLS